MGNELKTAGSEVRTDASKTSINGLNDVVAQTWSNKEVTRAESPQPVMEVAQVTHPSVRWDDPNLDKRMNQVLPDKTLRLSDMPSNVQLHYWVDKKGYFFWFEGPKVDPRPHYLNSGIQTIEYADKRDSVAKKIVETREAYMAKNPGVADGFYASFGKVDALEYYARMSRLSQGVLAKEESFLRQESGKSEKNPYFRIYLSDVLVAQAIQPIVEQVSKGQPIDFKNPQTTAKLNAALEQSQLAQQYANDGMTTGGWRLPGNAFMPMYPYTMSPDPNGPYYFWGGSLYQARQREVAIKALQYFIQSGALTDLLGKIELP